MIVRISCQCSVLEFSVLSGNGNTTTSLGGRGTVERPCLEAGLTRVAVPSLEPLTVLEVAPAADRFAEVASGEDGEAPGRLPRYRALWSPDLAGWSPHQFSHRDGEVRSLFLRKVVGNF